MLKVALLGRPNVGKSSLFNRFLGKRVAIVEDTPGVTRDRHYGLLSLEGGPIWLIDTGGFIGEKEGLEAQVAQQVRFAVEEADLLWWVVDAQTGLHPEDQTFGQWLRRHLGPDKPLWLLVNKADNDTLTQTGLEFYRLGVQPVFFVSATTGRGIQALREALQAFVQRVPAEETPEGPRFALIGRPNVGKSSLLNALVRAPRALVSDIPGTTRDALYEPAEWKGRRFFWIDTAGLRRKARIPPHSLERYAALRSLEALFYADVVLLVLDAVEPLTGQDLALLRQAEQKGRGLVLLVNKTDLLPPDEQKRLLEWIRLRVRPLDPVPILAVSALTGRGLSDIPKAAFEVYDAGHHTLPTRLLNDRLLPILRQHPHPVVGTYHPSVRFLQQVGTAPPTFLLHVRHGDKLRSSYLDFVRKQIRSLYPFTGWWIRLHLREEGE